MNNLSVQTYNILNISSFLHREYIESHIDMAEVDTGTAGFAVVTESPLGGLE